MYRRLFLVTPTLLLGNLPVAAQERPALLLANVYTPGVRLADYWVSEKFDGVRGYWTGQQLLTRGGEVIHAPAWFTQGWPAHPFEGELWAGRGRFANALSAVRQGTPNDADWRGLRFMVFDMPALPEVFTARMAAYQALVQHIGQPWVEAVQQVRVGSHAELQARLKATEQAGGEGLMLHKADSIYRGQRSDDLLKVKSSEDAEARVLAHMPGQGKHAGKLGALWVETTEGVRFKLGTGFTDAERRNPPAIGSWVTYRFRGTHAGSGAPRFASYLRAAPG